MPTTPLSSPYRFKDGTNTVKACTLNIGSLACKGVSLWHQFAVRRWNVTPEVAGKIKQLNKLHSPPSLRSTDAIYTANGTFYAARSSSGSSVGAVVAAGPLVDRSGAGGVNDAGWTLLIADREKHLRPNNGGQSEKGLEAMQKLGVWNDDEHTRQGRKDGIGGHWWSVPSKSTFEPRARDTCLYMDLMP
ncbi:hypothetical protein K438DRAFT_1764552 [Mycena galopus ATCC 62051]|nr:hypothetical protein K438DRAFT_1764552 [Mycena galopus ATCC 62051]